MDASAVHLFSGIWGTIACAIFCEHNSFLDAYQKATKKENGVGMLYDVSSCYFLYRAILPHKSGASQYLFNVLGYGTHSTPA